MKVQVFFFGVVLVGSSSCTVHCLSGLEIGSELSCSIGLRAEGVLVVNYSMFMFGIMVIYFLLSKSSNR